MAKQNNKSHTIISDMYCTNCGKKNLPVHRNMGQAREPGHLKRMYCVHCQKETNMVEIRPYGKKYTLEWFNLEYNMGNFKDGQRVEFKNLEPCSEKCHFCRDGKCWNANGSYYCEKREEVL